MNISLQQLVYIVAIDTYRSFTEAAKHSYVTQPTLSMQVKKLEDTIGATLFDRSKQPLAITDIGEVVIAQARQILNEIQYIEEEVKQYHESVEGALNISMIPTLSPYLTPLFVSGFLKKYPNVKLRIKESKTEEIIEELQKEHIDAGILATPINMPLITEIPLFYEQFMCYFNAQEAPQGVNILDVEDLLHYKIWLLSEGNCFRTQSINLCGIMQTDQETNQIIYESGSIEALMRIVDREGGVTLVPELSTVDLGEEKLDRLRFIKDYPVREISLVISRKKFKRKLIDLLAEEIKQSLPPQVRDNEARNILSIDFA